MTRSATWIATASTFEPIAGLSPDAEPSARHLAELSDLIRSEKITTVFTERLASPKLAETLASDLGIRTAVLDPIEGLTKSSSGFLGGLPLADAGEPGRADPGQRVPMSTPIVPVVSSVVSASAPVVSVRDAGVILGGRPIVRGIDFDVTAGEVVALLGANGSGKSTLVKAMVGLHPLSTGSVTLFGEPVQRFRQWSRLGYVPQRSTLAGGVPATVAEVVGGGRLSRRRPFTPMRRTDREAVRRALATVGLADRAGQQVSTLSGGQQQRVLVARTLAGEPDLLVLDEPNAGVDLASQESIAETLTSLVETGATIVVVLHELGPFAGLIQRTLELAEGRLVYDGPATALAR